MINKNTVLILGAGSSREVGFPLGKQLIQEIYALIKGQSKGCRKNAGGSIKDAGLDNTKLLGRLLDIAGEKKDHEQPYGVEDFENFARDLWNSRLPSIDDFLFHRPEYSLIGKICILFVLSDYEDAKRFQPFSQIQGGTFVPGHQPPCEWKYPSCGWYEYLFHCLREGTSGDFEKIKQNKLSIITFNYDRSLEHFLFTALQAIYGIQLNEGDIAEFFKRIPVKHVYGELGILSWKYNHLDEYRQKYHTQPDAINDFKSWNLNVLFRLWGGIGEYGVTPDDWTKNLHCVDESKRQEMAQLFIRRAKEIKTYNESIGEGDDFKDILSKAERVYFLGCAYHQQNLDILKLDTLLPLQNISVVLGSGAGLTEQEKKQKEALLKDRIKGHVEIYHTWNAYPVGEFKIESFLRNAPCLLSS